MIECSSTVTKRPVSRAARSTAARSSGFNVWMLSTRAPMPSPLSVSCTCNAALTPAQSGQVARALESFHLLWMDEPCPLQYFDALKKIAGETVTPLGFGGSLAEMQQLLASGIAGILRPDIDRLGVSNVRKIAALAESYYVAVAPKANSDALCIQVAASLANFFVFESPTLPLQDGYLAVKP